MFHYPGSRLYSFQNNSSDNDILEILLKNRGVSKRDFFYNPSSNPTLDNCVYLAAQVLLDAVENGKKIAVYGDFDADGITSTVILVKALQTIGADVGYYIPTRREGHGLHNYVLRDLWDQGYEILLTCDTGINDLKQIKAALDLGFFVIITDHHPILDSSSDIFRSQFLILHPSLMLDSMAYLSGAGVAFLLARCLLRSGSFSSTLEELNVFSMIGTVGDMVPPFGFNRAIIHNGLQHFTNVQNPGLIALAKELSLDLGNLSPKDIGYSLAPVLNAPNRMGEDTSPSDVVSFFLADDTHQISTMAKALVDLNHRRRLVTQSWMDQLVNQIDDSISEKTKILVVKASGMPEGLTGLVANQLAGHYHRPALVMTESLDIKGLWKGSGRSFGNFPLLPELLKLNNFFVQIAGHDQAFGFLIRKDEIDFLDLVLNHMTNFHPSDTPIQVDGVIHPALINDHMIDLLESLQPYGPSFWEPTFLLSCTVEGFRRIGKHKEHAVGTIRSLVEPLMVFPFVAWNQASVFDSMDLNQAVVLAFTPERVHWKGKIEIRLTVKAVYPTNTNVLVRQGLDLLQIQWGPKVKTEIPWGHL